MIPVLSIFYILQVAMQKLLRGPSNKQQQNILFVFVFSLEASFDMEMSERRNWQTIKALKYVLNLI
jgi:hypothetical protein